MERSKETHVLVMPFPAQGHINPMVQFSKRLASKGVKVSLVVTTSVAKTMPAQPTSINIEPISDSLEEDEKVDVDVEVYIERFKAAVSETLSDLICRLNSNSPPKLLVYDSVMPWALDVARNMGLDGAPFFTQSCSVNASYYHFHQGALKPPSGGGMVSLPSLPKLDSDDLPSFIYSVGPYGALLDMVLSQFSNLEAASWILINSFDDLEMEVSNWMRSKWPMKNIGPTVPSMYLDKRLEDDKDYGLSIFKPEAEVCLNWLNSKQPASVVYVSFGSLATLGDEQMKELTWGLNMCGSHFLWVVRESEAEKLSSRLREETREKGLIVKWSPQLEVLAHKSVGCFMSHCGWNSTLEALSQGVPLVAMPQWTDQPTNAKFVADVWQVGIRVKVNEEGIVSKEEINRCIREIMQGEIGKRIKQNSNKWKQLAKQAVDKGGSSDKSIEEFVAKLASN